MHVGEVATDAALVHALLAEQFPEWAALPIERVPSFGTDNALYRLGDELVVRLPRIHWAAKDIETDARWLEPLRPFLPVEIPRQLAVGRPAAGFPWVWGIYGWLEGELAVVGAVEHPERLARDMGRFVAALRHVSLGGAGAGSRAGPLAERDAELRQGIRAADDEFDAEAVTAAWEAALRVPAWGGPPVWTHGDLLRGNLLLRDGRLAAVIDWSLTGVGDPACDAIVAWSVLPPEFRDVFRAEAGFDGATWERGRGWALCCGLLQVPYYKQTNPELADNGAHMVREILAGR